MARPPSPPPIAEALNWVSRITSIGLMMVLPMVGGRWLDNRFGTSYWGLIGLASGLAIGLWQIALIAGVGKHRTPANKQSPSDRADKKPPDSSE